MFRILLWKASNRSCQRGQIEVPTLTLDLKLMLQMVQTSSNLEMLTPTHKDNNSRNNLILNLFSLCPLETKDIFLLKIWWNQKKGYLNKRAIYQINLIRANTVIQFHKLTINLLTEHPSKILFWTMVRSNKTCISKIYPGIQMTIQTMRK